MIEVKGLCAGYNGREVLHDISAAFPPGRVTAIIGPNGSGKTTLLKTVLRMNQRSGGDILIDGQSIDKLTPAQLSKKAAYLPQGRPTPDITVLRMVLHGRFPYLSYPRRYRAEDIAAAQKALAAVGMEEYAESHMASLSGGMRQKAYIAMALAQGAPTVFMDEPTAYLDIAHRMQVMRLARQLAAGDKAVVMVLHELELAFAAADGLLVLNGGRTAACGTPEELYQSGIVPRIFGVELHRVEAENAPPQYFCVREF